MGIDRTALDRWRIPDLRLLFDPDVRLLEQT
jgi:phenylalanyl-tRNA synthetase alpha subunit